MALKGRGKREIQRGVDNLEPFQAGNVRGDWYDSWADVPKGQLPHDAWMPRNQWGRRVYVIFSYATPIAWWSHDPHDAHKHEWTIPEVKYSPTTTNHQGVVTMATTHSGWYDPARW